MMNRQSLPDDATRTMLHSVSQAVGLLRETDFAPDAPTEDTAALLQSLGIRARPTTGQDSTTGAREVGKWRDIVSKVGIEALQKLFSQTRVIPFSEWTDVGQAADLWYGLLSGVIRPLGRNDWEFIFYLGNPAGSNFFDVDEILDVMGSFTRTGNVTLALEEREVSVLWSILFGAKSAPEFDTQDPEARARYRAIFQTLDIRRLIVYSESHGVLIMQDSYFDLTRPPVPAHTHNAYERANFIEGYALGLQNGMEPARCLALGIATSGSVAEGSTVPAKQEVLRFLSEWAGDI
ncbi:hypothetical protein SAMN05216327_102558 [Dyadobacter sp. SG02]|uniref:hypothetical protein n=1 Tax=Dyadobacter sp. SG02 TaxID=1855291 RepID=UPI0008CEB1CE|nr:hypothetical protein [Dyadobacter sp. SG02]SEI57862.1 hypothetical protein SAMN05216327_102558 [Dyadobacter sp. SG02]